MSMFNDDNWNDDSDHDMQDLLAAYEMMKAGKSTKFLDIEDFEILIDYFIDNSQEIEALYACDLAIQYFPNAVNIIFSKAEILFQQQKYGQSIQLLDHLEDLDPAFLDAIMLKSEVLVAQKKPQDAASYLNAKLPLVGDKEKIDILLELSDVYDECGEYELIFDVLEKVLAIDCRNDEALHKISFWSDFAGLQEKSIRIFLDIIEKDPYNAIAWFNLGVAYQGVKNYKEAIEAYEYCVAIDDTFEFAYRNLADAYIRLRWYEKAIESLQKNLELGNPEDVLFEAIGHCYDKQKDFENARLYYRKAIQLNPSDDELYYKIGATYFKEHAFENAAKSFGVALNLNKEMPIYNVALANSLLELGAEAMDVVTLFVQAIKLKPNSRQTWFSFLKALYKLEMYQDVMDELLIVEEIFQEKPEFVYIKVATLFKLGKTKEGILLLQHALALSMSKLKLLIELYPEILQRKDVANVVAAAKKNEHNED